MSLGGSTNTVEESADEMTVLGVRPGSGRHQVGAAYWMDNQKSAV